MASKNEKAKLLHWGRFLIAVFALILAATHLAYTGGSFSAPHNTQLGAQTSNSPAGAPAPGAMGFNLMGFWFDVEIIAYALIAVVFLLGLRTWYLASGLFNAFNLGIYLLSGFVAIPGITQNAFGNRLAFLSFSLSNSNILIISWIAVLVLSILLLKYDPGSELDALLVTRKEKAERTDHVSKKKQ